jgi:hypothetical protein
MPLGFDRHAGAERPAEIGRASIGSLFAVRLDQAQAAGWFGGLRAESPALQPLAHVTGGGTDRLDPDSVAIEELLERSDLVQDRLPFGKVERQGGTAEEAGP